MLVWTRLKKIAYESGKTIYTIKKSVFLDEISEKQIDKSVARILKLKGYSVVY